MSANPLSAPPLQVSMPAISGATGAPTFTGDFFSNRAPQPTFAGSHDLVRADVGISSGNSTLLLAGGFALALALLMKKR